MTILTALYQVNKRTITSIANPTNLTITQILNFTNQLYGSIVWNSQPVVLDITQIICRVSNLTTSQTLDTFLSSAVTDQFIASYQVTNFPVPNYSKLHVNRLITMDPLTISTFNVAAGNMAGMVVDPHRLSSAQDLIITGPDGYNFTNSLISINGVFHPTISNDNQLYVQNGYANIQTKKASNLMLADTTALGGHTILALNEAMLEPNNLDPWLGISLNLGSIDLSTSTVLLVIDGYLHLLDGSYSLLNINRLYLETPKLDLIKNFIHNPNVSFNPAPRNSGYLTDPFLANPIQPANTPAPSFTLGDPGYANDIGLFLVQLYPQILQDTVNLGYASPMVLFDIGTPTTLQAQQIGLFLQQIYPTISSNLITSVAFVEPGPPAGQASVLQDFIVNQYPLILQQITTDINQAALLYLAPEQDDFAYVIQDVLLNIYSYSNTQRLNRDVVLLSVGLDSTPPTALINTMNQFFGQYYPDMNVPAMANPNTNVAISDLATIKSFRIGLQGQKGLTLSDATSRSFLYDRIFSSSSFLIIIPNNNVYLNYYPLQSTGTATRFDYIGMDTPRGLLRYNHRHYLPYTILASQDFHFTAHIGLPSDTTDIIQTAINPYLWPAPHYDTYDKISPRAAQLIDVFTI